jgi:hypothetical protein
MHLIVLVLSSFSLILSIIQGFFILGGDGWGTTGGLLRQVSVTESREMKTICIYVCED